MRKPDPEVGQIVRFDFLWREEKLKGRIEGAKERPCAVVVAMHPRDDGSRHVYVVPITHSPPGANQRAIEISHQVKTITGLDEERSWLIVSELNRVDWSDPGIVPARKGQWLVGMLPRGLARRAVDEVLALSRGGKLRPVDRTR